MENENYFFGLGTGNFNDVLNCLSTTKVNSYQTSSIPMAEFWKPTDNLEKFINKFKEETNIDITNIKKYLCFLRNQPGIICKIQQYVNYSIYM